MTSDPAGTPSLAKVLAAFAAVYVVWGSTYLAIRYAIETLPPFLMAGVRFLIAGAALYAWVRMRGTPRPTRVQWRSAAVVGALLLVVGNGGVVWAERTVPSGVVALLVAMVPLWMVLLEWLRPGGQRPGPWVVAGLVIGFAGMVLLVGPAQVAGGGGVDLAGAAIVLVATVAWAAGSIYGRSAPLPDSPFLATAMEMIAGGALLTLVGVVRGEPAAFDPAAISAESAAAFAYLVVFGSLVGFTAYIWLLKVSTPSRVSTYAYVNPVVAVLLGWLIAGEPLNGRILGAMAIIVAAVAVITRRGSRKPAPPTAAPAPGAAGQPRRPRLRRSA